jgi:hypothetical protein
MEHFLLAKANASLEGKPAWKTGNGCGSVAVVGDDTSEMNASHIRT